MRWEDERYVRVYTRDTPEWCLLSWEARGVFLLILRAVDRAGLLKIGPSGAKAVAALIRAPLEVVEKALADLCADGCVEIRDGKLIVRNFQDAQEARQSDKLRAKASRERARIEAQNVTDPSQNVTDPSQNVTDPSQNVTDPSQNVTDRHAPSHGVTAGHTASLRAVPCCAVLPPEGSAADAPPAPAPPPDSGGKQLDLPGAVDRKPRRAKASGEERATGIGWRTFRAEYERAFGRKYSGQSTDGGAMQRAVKLAEEMLSELGRPATDLEELLSHRWRKYFADPGHQGFLREKAHALQYFEGGIAAYGTPWDGAGAAESGLSAKGLIIKPQPFPGLSSATPEPASAPSSRFKPRPERAAAANGGSQ